MEIEKLNFDVKSDEIIPGSSLAVYEDDKWENLRLDNKLYNKSDKVYLEIALHDEYLVDSHQLKFRRAFYYDKGFKLVEV